MDISKETHQFILEGVVTKFEVQKLLRPIWGNDYLIYWETRLSYNAYYYCSKYNTFCGLTGEVINNPKYQIKLKAKNKPWTAKDAVERLDHILYAQNGLGLGSISEISKTGVKTSYGHFYSYERLVNETIYVGISCGCSPAFHENVKD